jgi:hypothetical protein
VSYIHISHQVQCLFPFLLYLILELLSASHRKSIASVEQTAIFCLRIARVVARISISYNMATFAPARRVLSNGSTRERTIVLRDPSYRHTPVSEDARRKLLDAVEACMLDLLKKREAADEEATRLQNEDIAYYAKTGRSVPTRMVDHENDEQRCAAVILDIFDIAAPIISLYLNSRSAEKRPKHADTITVVAEPNKSEPVAVACVPQESNMAS